MSEDWLDTTPVPLIPATLPTDPAARLQLVTELWQTLSDSQRKFLTAYRHCGLNARKTNKQLTGRHETPASHTGWMHQDAYRTIVRIWRGVVSDAALDRDRLLARQDDIVETLLTPKPVLHEGIMVRDTRPGAAPDAVLEEVEAGAASRANEVLMKAAGLLKDKELDVNVGLVGPSLVIQVMQPDGTLIEARPQGVAVPELPGPASDGDEWLSAH